MAYRLTYTAHLDQCDADGNPDGYSFTYSGQQFDAAASPQTADLTAMVTAMATDITAQMTTGANAFPVQLQDDGSGANGGQG